MKQIVITLPENKVEFFIELMNEFSFVKKIESKEFTKIQEWHRDPYLLNQMT